MLQHICGKSHYHLQVMGFIIQSQSWGQVWLSHHLGSVTTICSFNISLKNLVVWGPAQEGKRKEDLEPEA